jgi:hypothetical protein
MGTKNHPGKFDFYANADPDEPMFVLLGRDPHAPDAVRNWADDREASIRAGIKPTEDMRMVWEARECAAAMEKYAIERRQRSIRSLGGGDSEAPSYEGSSSGMEAPTSAFARMWEEGLAACGRHPNLMRDEICEVVCADSCPWKPRGDE